ncbi:hypothetical protein AVEN_156778-1 [Araneus ventricosus]|uniref:Uncharacterized protein n=1 Tax=Araneus ventricosus TaxID=182803 RepID=A0A4Y2QXJ5_ARAVE|nr:hypothetical protein AVEN_156778-1 [Araneus ventricosus]
MRDSLDPKIKTIKQIQCVQLDKYSATSIARRTTSCCNTCRNTVRHCVDWTFDAVLGQMDPQRLNSHLQIMYGVTHWHLVLQLVPHMLFRRQVWGAGRPSKSLNMTSHVGSKNVINITLSRKVPRITIRVDRLA